MRHGIFERGGGVARWLVLLLALALSTAADKPRLIPDVSQRRIDIVYSFTGADLLMFGAIVYPGGVAPRAPPDVVIVVKGPDAPVLLREKQKVAGIWMNAESARFRSVPAFYAVASSRPLEQMVSARTAAIYELGLSNIQLSPTGGVLPEVQGRFEAGLVDLKRRNALYVEAPGAVELREGVLYRARIAIPARVPVGRYTAETFLIQDGRVVAAEVRRIAIDKSGFERFVAAAADQWSFAYGLVAVGVSLAFGYAASVAFRRG